MPSLDSALLEITAAAASFEDRAAHEHFVPRSPDAGETRAAVTAWLERATADSAQIEKLLAHLGEHGHPLVEGLRPVVLRNPADLPGWAAALADFVRAQPDRPLDAADPIGEAARLAAPILLPRNEGALHGTLVADAAWDGMVRCLEDRLRQACGAALRSGEGSWLERFAALPGLAYAVGTVCRQWRSSLTELFVRLDADRELLRAELWDGEEPVTLTGFRGEAGDRHADGRSVALLEFADGHGAVYKPKDQRHAAAFMALVEFLNARGLESGLRTYRVLLRENYSWEERIVATPCADQSDFELFYRRLGMYVRLFQLLEARDMWADNLIAVGAYPVFIDLECVLTPRARVPEDARGQAVHDYYARSVVPISTLHQPWNSPNDLPVSDIGCLSDAGDLRNEQGGALLPLPTYRPWHGDETAQPTHYAAAVIDGYRSMQRCLAAAQPELAAPNGPLAAFRDVPVRYIWRSTWDCYRMINATVRPSVLTTGLGRDLALAVLLRNPLSHDGRRTDRVEIALAEINAFRRLDIPLFRSTTTSSSVFSADGVEIPGHFDGTAWERLAERVAELREFPTEAHIELLEASIDAARDAAELLVAPVFSFAGSSVPSSAELLDAAAEIGERVLAADHGTRDEPGWIGLSWFPATGLRQVEVLGPDLLTGTAGISVLFAELCLATKDVRFGHSARTTLETGYAYVEILRGYSDRRVAGGAPVPGGFLGPGALIHALARCADALDDTSLLAHAHDLVPAASASFERGNAFADVPMGNAGLLLNLLRLRRADGPQGTTDSAIRRLSDAVIEEIRQPRARLLSGPIAGLLPVGMDSLVMALARVLAEAPDLLRDPQAAHALVLAHSFDPTRRSGRLARIETNRALGLGPVSLPATLNQQPATWTCRELVATGGELLAAYGPLGADADHPAASVLRELLDRRARTGRWLSDRQAPDTADLGSVRGLVAVGLLLLEAADPRHVPLTVLR